jgi:hypothetical protein
VQNLFNSCAGKTQIVIASRYEETPVFDIDSTARYHFRPFRQKVTKHQFQLSLFH